MDLVYMETRNRCSPKFKVPMIFKHCKFPGTQNSKVLPMHGFSDPQMTMLSPVSRGSSGKNWS